MGAVLIRRRMGPFSRCFARRAYTMDNPRQFLVFGLSSEPCMKDWYEGVVSESAFSSYQRHRIVDAR